jgi:putative flippase GtrA
MHWIKFNGWRGGLCSSVGHAFSASSQRTDELPTATAVAVELAVLHNFVWHHCWTWRDWPSATSAKWCSGS